MHGAEVLPGPRAAVSPASAAGIYLDRLLQRPARILVLVCLAQTVFWTLATATTHFAPTRDIAESYLWGHEWVIGSYKHPNLPGWLLEAGRVATGAVGWPAYLTSELLLVATYLAVYRLGTEMMGEARALAGVLLLSGLYYTAWPSTLMNHDVVQMPLWAGIFALLWHLRARPGYWAWLGLGVLAALGLYAKLSFGVVIASAALWLLYDPALRRQLVTPAPWLGLGLFAVCSLPLVGWLRASQFSALAYARDQSSQIGESPFEFIGGQLLTSLGVVGLAALAGLLAWPATSLPSALPKKPASRQPVVLYLAHMLVVPNLMTTALAWLMASGARGMWGTPMLSLVGLLIVALAPGRLDHATLKRLTVMAGALLVAVPAIYAADTLIEPRLTGTPKRQGWPQAEMNKRFQTLWLSQTHRPLRIVAGNFWVAGLVALSPNDMPSILTNGDMALSPWITPERLKQQGALLVWEMRNPAEPPPAELVPLVGERPTGVERFDWPVFTGAPQLLIGYAIVAPN